MAFKMKGFTPFTKKIDPVKKPVGPVTPSTNAEYMSREVWNVVQRNKDKKKKKKTDKDFDEKYNRANQKSPLKKMTDPPKKKKPVDDDTDKMTPEQEAAHRAKVLEYNKNVSKPMTELTKRKIKEQLAKMDPNDPEAKLLQDMLNLPKNK
tara:strand:- start:3 stop:452 length:450 start_codon:yes stop_codon:yes gene_type:complete